MPKPVIAWKCDYCNFVDLYDGEVVLEHEKTCPYNPATQTCYTCRHETFVGPCAQRACEAPRPHLLWHFEKGMGRTAWPEVPLHCQGWEAKEKE